MITLRTYLRTNRSNSKGESVIYFIVNDEWITTKIKIQPDFWDAENSVITKKHPKYYTINPTFQLYKSRAEQCISNYQTTGNIFDKSFFEKFVFNDPDQATNPNFEDVIKAHVEQSNLGYGRVKHYEILAADIKSILPNARLNDINYVFALRFQASLRDKKQPNGINTIASKMRQLKAVVHTAQKMGLLSKDPLAHIKIKERPGTKKYLTAEELDILENLYQTQTLSGSFQQTLKYFLFSCYTALRYCDIVTLKYSDIKDDLVMTTQQKTQKPVTIPLIPKAKALLENTKTGLCFDTFTNQGTNRILKEIMPLAGINKKITYHCSRHTFGTLSIVWGIPDYLVAELMGVDLKTSKIYAKIVDQVKVREMMKWEKKVV